MSTITTTTSAPATVAQHTPGPWQSCYQANGRFIVESARDLIRPEKITPIITTVANARLIAAAPCLLAAARQLVDCCEVAARIYGDKMPATAGMITAWKMAKDAIAKAEGAR